MLFADLAATSAAVARHLRPQGQDRAARRRLRRLAAAPATRVLAAGAGYLAGELRQRQTGVG